MKEFLAAVIRCYQAALSPLVGPACRFAPSCSQYLLEAVEVHGACRGIFLGISRILRCHPFSLGGLDPVPRAGAFRRR